MLKILCIDDDQVFADLYKNMLEPHGYQVLWCGNAAQGHAAAEHEKPDLILLDVMMPESGGIRDGFDLLERLRKSESCAKTPVIMISAIGGGPDERHGLELGANAYISKPDLTPAVLLAKVKELTEGK